MMIPFHSSTRIPHEFPLVSYILGFVGKQKENMNKHKDEDK